MKNTSLSIEFRYEAPEAKQVALVGDFTNWNEQPILLRRTRNGTWSKKVALPPGRHQYRYQVDGFWQDDPDCAQRMANPFGTENCVVEVD